MRDMNARFQVFFEKEKDLFGIYRLKNIFIASCNICLGLCLLGRICGNHYHCCIFPFFSEKPYAFDAINKRNQEIHENKINCLIILYDKISKLFPGLKDHYLSTR